MSNINVVLEGKYKGTKIKCINPLHIDLHPISKRYVSSYTLIDESNKDQFSFGKAALGVAVFGGIGAIAGVNGKKRTEYLVAIEWKDGEKSLICIDEDCYKTLVKSMF